jgi:hypothetical protein
MAIEDKRAGCAKLIDEYESSINYGSIVDMRMRSFETRGIVFIPSPYMFEERTSKLPANNYAFHMLQDINSRLESDLVNATECEIGF